MLKVSGTVVPYGIIDLDGMYTKPGSFAKDDGRIVPIKIEHQLFDRAVGKARLIETPSGLAAEGYIYSEFEQWFLDDAKADELLGGKGEHGASVYFSVSDWGEEKGAPYPIGAETFELTLTDWPAIPGAHLAVDNSAIETSEASADMANGSEYEVVGASELFRLLGAEENENG